jgi:hypothetical protein
MKIASSVVQGKYTMMYRKLFYGSSSIGEKSSKNHQTAHCIPTETHSSQPHELERTTSWGYVNMNI